MYIHYNYIYIYVSIYVYMSIYIYIRSIYKSSHKVFHFKRWHQKMIRRFLHWNSHRSSDRKRREVTTFIQIMSPMYSPECSIHHSYPISSYNIIYHPLLSHKLCIIPLSSTIIPYMRYFPNGISHLSHSYRPWPSLRHKLSWSEQRTPRWATFNSATLTQRSSERPLETTVVVNLAAGRSEGEDVDAERTHISHIYHRICLMVKKPSIFSVVFSDVISFLNFYLTTVDHCW